MKLNNLQILRGISALLVCCFHFKEVLNFDANSWGEKFFIKGSIGVPIFFVISGYIMVFSTKKIAHTNVLRNIRAFFKKRIIRIVPLYYLLTFAWMFLSGSLIYFLNVNETVKLPKSLLFLPIKNEFPILYLGWSLNYEMFFYFIFALSLIFKKFRYFFTILVFVVLIGLGLTFSFENAFLRMITDFLNLYFIIGVLLGLFLEKIPKRKSLMFIYCIFSIFLFTLYFFNILPVHNQFLVLAVISLFVAAFLIFDLFLEIRANSFLKMLGDISYSIYLSHPFVEIFFRRFQPESPTLIVLLFIIKLAVVIIISKLLYEIVEKKFTNYLKNNFIPHLK